MVFPNADTLIGNSATAAFLLPAKSMGQGMRDNDAFSHGNISTSICLYEGTYRHWRLNLE